MVAMNGSHSMLIGSVEVPLDHCVRGSLIDDISFRAGTLYTAGPFCILFSFYTVPLVMEI